MRQYVPYFGYRRHSISVGDYNVSYWDEGSGQPIVLVHGLGGCREYWAWVFPMLVGQFRVIALDLPGFGESTVPDIASIRIDNAVKLLGDFTAALDLDQPPMLVGHSMGGSLALRCAARYPQQFSGVMALCPPGFGREIDLVSRVLTLPLLGEALFQPTHATIFRFLNCDPAVQGLEHLAALTYERLRQPDARLRHLTILRQGVRLWGQTVHFTSDELASFKGNIGIVWGDHDQIFPVRQAGRIAAWLPRAAVTTIPAGHMMQVEQPALVSRLIANFAAEQVARAA